MMYRLTLPPSHNATVTSKLPFSGGEKPGVCFDSARGGAGVPQEGVYRGLGGGWGVGGTARNGRLGTGQLG